MPEHAAGKPIEIWFTDEARVGQQGTLTRIWARRGTRPRAPRDRRYAWTYLFGAVCPERAVGAGLVLPFANTEAMCLHLQEISRHITPGAHAVLVLDGAGWHGLAALGEVPRNLTLLPLPPYSPELNPVENVWQYLRQNQLSLRDHQARGMRDAEMGSIARGQPRRPRATGDVDEHGTGLYGRKGLVGGEVACSHSAVSKTRTLIGPPPRLSAPTPRRRG